MKLPTNDQEAQDIDRHKRCEKYEIAFHVSDMPANVKRSHAGPVTQGCKADARPALAGASGGLFSVYP
jgi:hypothetical protein